jgi:hypothetical protein
MRNLRLHTEQLEQPLLSNGRLLVYAGENWD